MTEAIRVEKKDGNCEIASQLSKIQYLYNIVSCIGNILNSFTSARIHETFSESVMRVAMTRYCHPLIVYSVVTK